MKINIKNISVIIGVILVLGIGAWYATSEISEAKAAKVKTAHVVKSLRDKLASVGVERDELQSKLVQLNKELSESENLIERDDALHNIECVKAGKFEEVDKKLRKQLIGIDAKLKEDIFSLICDNKEAIKTCSESINDISRKAIDEKWNTDKVVRMIVSAHVEANVSFLKNADNMLDVMKKSDDKIKDALGESVKDSEIIESIYNEQKEEVLKNTAAYWEKVTGHKE